MSQILNHEDSSVQDSRPIIQVKNLTVRFRKKQKNKGIFERGDSHPNLAVNNVSLNLYPSEILSIVGETGSEKRPWQSASPSLRGRVWGRTTTKIGKSRLSKGKIGLTTIAPCK